MPLIETCILRMSGINSTRNETAGFVKDWDKKTYWEQWGNGCISPARGQAELPSVTKKLAPKLDIELYTM
jgi:hypothetical protein